MQWNPDDFSEYGKTPNDNDYANPTFYQHDTVRTPISAQPVQPVDVHSDYAHGPTVVNSYDPALMSEYRGPANIDGYTTDAGAEQREAAERGGVENGSKRKGLAGSVCLIIALQAPHERSIWAPLAYFGFFINLFNLIPIVPFDGGRVLAAIDRRIWIVGFLGLVAFQVWSWFNGSFSPWLLFFVILSGSQLWARRTLPNQPNAKSYYTVPLSERIILGIIYFGLAAVLAFGMSISHNLLPGVAQ